LPPLGAVAVLELEDHLVVVVPDDEDGVLAKGRDGFARIVDRDVDGFLSEIEPGYTGSTIAGDTSTGTAITTACGSSVPGQVFEISTASTTKQCFKAIVSDGFQAGTFGPVTSQYCGGIESCERTVTGCVVAGSPKWFAVQATSGGTGASTLTVRPRP
jgi:hypothetical protein